MPESENSPFSFVKEEKKILNFWQKNKIFQKTLEKTKAQKPYIFYDGPPFATGLPHHGHLVGSILKDIIPRYFTMRGHYVERKFGWDCHGLPVEYEIDKKLGMSAQDAVTKLGVAAYNKECRSIVQRYTEEWQKTITRIGRWVDFKNGYKTMDSSFMESVWWVFKQLWEKDLIYKGTKVMPFSTALGTILSNFEAGQNYQDVQDPAVTVLFKASDENAYFAAWTTTPWTLPSNLGLCVGADIDYVLLNDEDMGINLYIASARVPFYSKKRSLKTLKTVKGRDLCGKTYEPLFPYFKNFKSLGAFQVFNDDYVTTDNGTGIVHTAPSFGEDDNRVMKEAGIHLFACPIDDNGKFTSEVSDYQGLYVKDADKQIQKDLKQKGLLYEQGVIVHSYPMCYRSDTPLLYKAIPSWYVNVEKLKKDLLASNAQINWVPEHIKEGRFGKWLEGARDWAISRNRVWGTPLPVWINDVSKKNYCIGSISELNQLTGSTAIDLHRESVDHLTFTLPGEEGTYRKIPEILDCWFESGAMPYAQLHYPFENKDFLKNGFPAEFIAEGLDQTRGWFYTLTILSTALFQKPAFKNVIVNGMVLAEDGKKMSKRLNNYTPPDQLMETFGADALRLYLITSGLVKAEEQRFSDGGVKDMVRRALLPWYNSFKFLKTYAEVDGWHAETHFSFGDNITDRWILSNLQTLKQNISTEMESYKLYNVVPALFTFIEDLTNWYIRLNRSRYWGEGLSPDKCAAYSTLYTAINQLSLVMAPFAPFLAEYIYQELTIFGEPNRLESVHLCDFPRPAPKHIDSTLENAMAKMQQIILLGRQKRNKVQIKVKIPMNRLTIIHKDQQKLDDILKLERYIQTELNVKKIEYSTEENKFINLFARPNAPILGKKLGKDFKKFAALISKLPPKKLIELEKIGSLTLLERSFSAHEILIFREAKEGTEAMSNRFISIDLDCQLNEKLINEGLAREVVNRIQKTRKDLNLNVSDRIKVQFNGPEIFRQVMDAHKDYIARETLAENITEVASSTEGLLSFKIESFDLQLKVEKQ